METKSPLNAGFLFLIKTKPTPIVKAQKGYGRGFI